MKLKHACVIAASAAAALSAAIVVPVLTHAQSPTATTITLQEKVQGVVTDDVAPKSKRGKVSLGDRLITRQSLFDPGKKRIGTLYTDCTGVGPPKPFRSATLLCRVAYTFSDGQIVAAGSFKLDGSGRLPIVGGTGTYAGVRGSVSSAKPAKGYDSADLITIGG